MERSIQHCRDVRPYDQLAHDEYSQQPNPFIFVIHSERLSNGIELIWCAAYARPSLSR